MARACGCTHRHRRTAHGDGSRQSVAAVTTPHPSSGQMAAWWLSTTIARHCTAGTSADCPIAPNGTDPKKNETVMMARTFRMAFAESWDGPHLSLRGFKSSSAACRSTHMSRSTKQRRSARRGVGVSWRRKILWFGSTAWRRSTNCSRTNSTAGRGAPGKLSAATQNPPPRTSFVGLLL